MNVDTVNQQFSYNFYWEDKVFFVYIKNEALNKLTVSKDSDSSMSASLNELGPNHLLAKEIEEQVMAFLEQRLKKFDLPLEPKGSAFQKSVWSCLKEIPYGEVRSYKDIALKLGGGHMSRAVGGANGANPIPLIIPCHRVVTSKGHLGGFAYGSNFKQRLLALEGSEFAL